MTEVVLTPFLLKPLMWDTLVSCSSYINTETEAGEGVILPGGQGQPRGAGGLLSPILPYQHLISILLLGDEMVTLEITKPVTHQLT